MKKTYLLIVGLILIFLAISAIALLSKKTPVKSSSSPTQTATTPTPFTSELSPTPFNINNLPLATLNGKGKNAPLLSVVSSSPYDKSITIDINGIIVPPGTNRVSTHTAITIVFNRNFSSDEISFSLTPQTKYSQTITGNTLTIVPTDGYQSNTVYLYTVKTVSNPDTSFGPQLFLTEGSGTPIKPNLEPNNFAAQQDQFELQNSPDTFLSNKTPYSTSTFSVTNDFASSPTGHFFFTVKLIGSDQSQDKQDFLTWVKSLGLTDTQIQSLDIRYQ